MKICIAIGSIGYRHMQEFDCYRLWRSCGFRYVDYNFFSFLGDDSSRYMQSDWLRQAENTRLEMERIGMYTVLSHAPAGEPAAPNTTEGILRRTIRAIECGAVMGVKDMVFHPGAQPGMTRAEYLAWNVAYIHRLMPAAEKAGMNLLIENVGRWDEAFYAHNALELLDVVDAVNHPLMHACLDTGHLGLQDGSQYEAIAQLGTHLKAVHVQDNFGSMPVPITNRAWRQDLHLPPLMGTVDFDEVLQGLSDIGYQGVFDLEVESPRCFEKASPHCVNPRLQYMPPELTQAYFCWIYNTTKDMLTSYDLFEE